MVKSYIQCLTFGIHDFDEFPAMMTIDSGESSHRRCMDCLLSRKMAVNSLIHCVFVKCNFGARRIVFEIFSVTTVNIVNGNENSAFT